MTREAIKTPGEAAGEHDPAAPADPAPTAPPTVHPPRSAAPVVVPRWIQLVLLPMGLLALWALARAAGSVLLVFLVAAVIALILNPLVRLLQRTRLPRGLCVLAVYLGFFAAMTGIVALLIDPVSNQVASFQRDVPRLAADANASLAKFQTYLDSHQIGIHVKKPGQTALQTLQRTVLKGSGSLVSFTRDLVQRLAEGAFALVLVLVISIYMLLYGPTIGRLVRSVMPAGDGSPEDDYPLRVQKAVFSYVRGQLLFSLIMGTTAGVALWLFGLVGIFPEGKTYALAFGAFFGLMELVPYIGPVLGALPPVIVALVGDPLTAVWVALLFVVLQQLEGHVVAPQVFGHSLRINPLLIIFALLFGTQTYGIIGALIALPLAAVARETVVYLRRHLVLESWSTVAAGPLHASGALAQPPPEGRRCPECGSPTRDSDSYCATCGAGLGVGVRSPG
jgi:predicted PurR-regulated permease PerM